MQKNKRKDNRNSSNLTNINSLISDLQKAISKEFELQQKSKLSSEELSKKLEEIRIPISVFKTNLAPLESLIKYLKENLNFSYKKISVLLSRSNKTIWSSYNLVSKKEKFSIRKSEILIPISIFSDRKFSILESLVQYLKSQQFSFKQISDLLQKDYRTIWTCYSRAKKKNE